MLNIYSNVFQARRKHSTFIASFIAIFALWGGFQAAAQERQSNASPSSSAQSESAVAGFGDVNVYPKRIVLDGRRQIKTIGLFNKAVNEGDYQISIASFGMMPSGQILAFDNGLDAAVQARVKTAEQFLRHSPRRVTLRGAESQLINVMARAPSDLPDGEYRSHFVITAIPRELGGTTSIEQAASDTQANEVGVTIYPQFGISIPIIIRIGETTLNVGLSDLQMVKTAEGQAAVSFKINRQGTRSAFGDIVIRAQGLEEPLVSIKGVGVYPEIDSRQLVVPLDRQADAARLTRGTAITVTYLDDDAEPGNILAERTFALP
ncbi:hypothetical protein [Erythrobacter sp.]|uniref:hypothetical protein n=1 Tax=Erythrobacter sp. TaxID=1042 RepID=UPI00311D9BA2